VQTTAGQRPNPLHRRGVQGQPAPPEQPVDRGGTSRWHAVTHPIPRACILGQERQAVRLAEARPQRAQLVPQAVDAGPPVAGGGLDVTDVGGHPDSLFGKAAAPVRDLRDDRGRGHCRVAVRQQAGPADRVQHPALPGPLTERHRDVDHGQARSHQQHVRRSGPVPRHHIQRTGGPRIGDEEVAAHQLVGCPGAPRPGEPGCQHHCVGLDPAAVVQPDQHRPSAPVDPHRGAPLHRETHTLPRVGQRRAHRVVEIVRIAAARCELVGTGRLRAGTAPPGHEMCRVLGQCAHARRRHVQQVRLVACPERRPGAQRGGRVDHQDV